jgi:hypothetical protein
MIKDEDKYREPPEVELDFGDIDEDKIPLYYELVEFKRKRGRNHGCTRELAQMLGQVLIQGASVIDACAIVGISASSYYKWKQLGNEAISRAEGLQAEGMGIDYTEDEAAYVMFVDVISRAIPLRKLQLLDRIRKAGEEQWQANAWLLERQHPTEFGRKTQHKIVDWRDEVIDLIKSRTITFEVLEGDLGSDEAKRLFERAGTEIPASGTSTETS